MHMTPEQETKQRRIAWLAVIVVAIGALLAMAFTLDFRSLRSSGSEETFKDYVASRDTWGAVDLSSLGDIQTVSMNRDYPAVKSLLASGRVFGIDKGTRVHGIITNGIAIVYVQSGAHFGEKIFIDAGAVE